MKITNTSLLFFSATYTTRKIVRIIAQQIGEVVTEYDITQTAVQQKVDLDMNDLLIIGMPVYAGRIPSGVLESIDKFKGNNTPAIIVCVYGNRNYDDALLELNDTVEKNGFRPISAGAFIAQHSIFPSVGKNRPDNEDIAQIKAFAYKSADYLNTIADITSLSSLQLNGNRPYKVPGNIPLSPRCNTKCNGCGSCVKLCLTNAIPEENPRKSNKAKCIACGRCIVVCPQKARHFGGFLYKLVEWKFIKTNSARKEPEMIFAT